MGSIEQIHFSRITEYEYLYVRVILRPGTQERKHHTDDRQ